MSERGQGKTEKIEAGGRGASLFAFLVKLIAATIAENIELNSIRSAHRIVEFEHVQHRLRYLG